MASKGGTEHKCMHLKLGAYYASRAVQRIEEACDEMQRGGWALVSVSWPNERTACLVFSRARKGESR